MGGFSEPCHLPGNWHDHGARVQHRGTINFSTPPVVFSTVPAAFTPPVDFQPTGQAGHKRCPSGASMNVKVLQRGRV